MKVAIMGAGGMGREILDILEACIEAGEEWEVLGWVVDPEYGVPGAMINGLPILGDLPWLATQPGVHALCGLGPPQLRRRFVQRAQALGIPFATVVHPTAIVPKRITVGTGVVIAAGCIFTNNCQVHDHVQINLACTISHDTVLGAYSTLAPGVHITGFVELGEGAYLGAGAVVNDHTRVGAWAIVGSGAAVVQDIPPNTTAVGVPAKVRKTRQAGWHEA